MGKHEQNPYQQKSLTLDPLFSFFVSHDRFLNSSNSPFQGNHRRPGTFEATFEKVMQSHITMSEMNPLGDWEAKNYLEGDLVTGYAGNSSNDTMEVHKRTQN